jgi:hypothetical protein
LRFSRKPGFRFGAEFYLDAHRCLRLLSLSDSHEMKSNGQSASRERALDESGGGDHATLQFPITMDTYSHLLPSALVDVVQTMNDIFSKPVVARLVAPTKPETIR